MDPPEPRRAPVAPAPRPLPPVDPAPQAPPPEPEAPEPYLEYVDATPPRLLPVPVAEALPPDPSPRHGTPALVLAGCAVLAAGFTILGAANFVADQFARATWLGWLTAAVAATGFGLAGTGIWRELRALLALDRVDRLRADLQSGDATRMVEAARIWAGRVPAGAGLLPALRMVNDPDAALALLRAGPSQALRDASEALARGAAVQVVAGIAAVPSPSLDVLLVAWRGTRLVRQIAALYGVRPGVLGTLALLRRTALSATAVGAAEIAGNTLAHGLLSSPLLAKAIGEAAGAGIAARRMVVLGRAAAAACDPVPPA